MSFPEEHQAKVNEAFDALDRCLDIELIWEPVVEKKGVTVSYHAFEGDPVSTFRGDGIIAVHPKKVLELLTDEKRRGDWDLFYADGRLIERISETEGYVYYQTKSQGWTVWARDFVMAISAHIFDSSNVSGEQEAKFIGVSVIRDDTPDVSGCVRGTVVLGGYHLLPVKVGDDIHCRVIYIMNIDAAGWIPHSVADMANTYQPLSIIGLRKALTGSSDP